MRHFKILIVSILMLGLLSSNGFALSIDVIGFNDSAEDGIDALERNDWTEVAEMEDVGSDSRVSASGEFYNFGLGLWLLDQGTYAQTDFSLMSNSLFVQFFNSDHNDGTADFYIDNSLVYSLNTNYGGVYSNG